MNAAPPSNEVSSNGEALIPPEERFWKRYSPRMEFPLSGAGSVAFHVFVLALLVPFIGWLIHQPEAPRMGEPIAIGTMPGGGGVGGDGRAPGSGPKESVHPDQQPDQPTPVTPIDKQPEPDIKPEPVDPLIPAANLAAVNTRADATTQAIQAFHARRDANANAKSGNGTGGAGGTGPAGPPGPGIGDGGREGVMRTKLKRADRWDLNFDTRTGMDYLMQLRGLGAILAFAEDPLKPDLQRFWVIRDLSSLPASPKMEDAGKIWLLPVTNDARDRAPTSKLADVLGLRPTPPIIVIFLPEEVEQDMLRKELNAAGKREDQIRRTWFRIQARGSGYEAVVINQQ